MAARVYGVLRELILVLPLGLVSALSPVMLAEQTVLLAGEGGRRAAARYATGTALVVVVFVGALMAFGHALSLPRRPTLNATSDVVAGVGLLLVAFLVRRWPQRQTARTGRRLERPAAAFGFGLFSMATNFSTLAVLVPAVKDVSASSLNPIGKVVLAAVLVALPTTPAWLPVAMVRVAGGSATRVLGAVRGVIERDGRRFAVAGLTVLGVALVGRGVWRLVAG